MVTWETLSVYTLLAGVLVLIVIFDQFRVAKLRKKIKTLEKYIRMYDVPTENIEEKDTTKQ